MIIFHFLKSVKNSLLIVKNFYFLFSIGQQIFYNGDSGNFGTTALHSGYRLYYT